MQIVIKNVNHTNNKYILMMLLTVNNRRSYSKPGVHNKESLS